MFCNHRNSYTVFVLKIQSTSVTLLHRNDYMMIVLFMVVYFIPIQVISCLNSFRNNINLELSKMSRVVSGTK
jgi:hypothetical protein